MHRTLDMTQFGATDMSSTLIATVRAKVNRSEHLPNLESNQPTSEQAELLSCRTWPTPNKITGSEVVNMVAQGSCDCDQYLNCVDCWGVKSHSGQAYLF